MAKDNVTAPDLTAAHAAPLNTNEAQPQAACRQQDAAANAATADHGPDAASSIAPTVVEQVTTSDKIAWSSIIMLGMLTAFGPFCTDLYLPAVPTITRELNTDASTMQLTLTTSFLGLALGQLFIGPLSDAFGRKRPLYASLIIFALSSAACAYAPNITFLVIARLFQGMAGAGGIVLSRAIACDMYQGARLTQFMSLLMTVNSLAPILGPIVGSLITTFFDWPAMFLFLALWGVLLLLGSLKAVPESLPPVKRSPQISAAIMDMLKEFTNARFMCLALSLSFVQGSFFGYLASSPFIFQTIFGLSPLAYSLVFAANAACITVAANGAGFMAKRFSEPFVVKLALVWQLIATAAFGLDVLLELHNIVLVGLSLAIFVAMMGAAQTAGFGPVMGSRSGGAGAASGLFGVLTFIFGAIAAPLVGLMGETSMLPQFLVMVVCTICALILFHFGLKRHNF